MPDKSGTITNHYKCHNDHKDMWAAMEAKSDGVLERYSKKFMAWVPTKTATAGFGKPVLLGDPCQTQLPSVRVIKGDEIQFHTNYVAAVVVKDLRPIKIVEDDGFRSLTKKLHPGFSMPDRRTVVRTLHGMRLARISSISKHLKEGRTLRSFSIPIPINLDVPYVCKDRIEVKVPSTVSSFNADLWSNTSMQSFLGCGMQSVDHNFQIENIVLGCQPFSKRHLSENIRSELRTSIFSRFNIPLLKNNKSFVAGVIDKGMWMFISS